MNAPTSPVTVVVPSYLHAPYIAKTLASLLAQTRPPAAIVVINDGSPDDTDQAVAPYLAQIAYIKRPHQGLLAGVREGLRRVRTPYVMFVASDDWLEPYALKTFTAVLEAHSDVGVVHSWRMVEDENGFTLSGPPLRGKHRASALILSGHYVFGSPCVMWRMEAAESAGRFLRFSTSLDWARWIGVTLEGWYCYALPDVLGHYRRHAGQMTDPVHARTMIADELRMLRFTRRIYQGRLSRPEAAAVNQAIAERVRGLAWLDLRSGRGKAARRRFRRLVRRPGMRTNALVGLTLGVLPGPAYRRLKALRGRWQ